MSPYINVDGGIDMPAAEEYVRTSGRRLAKPVGDRRRVLYLASGSQRLDP